MSLRLENLKKAYRSPDGTVVPTVNVRSLELADGQQVALTGSSGSGKTTLLNLIAGILAPDAGSVRYQFANQTTDITGLNEPQRDVFRGRYLGYIFQTSFLIPAFTALENVLLGMSFTGRHQDKHWAGHLLEEVGLKDRSGYRPRKLSVGQQQRVAVARALANRPKLVLADEPSGSLDAKNAQQVLELIRRLCAEVAATLILVTHDEKIAAQLPGTLRLAEINAAGSL